MTNDLGPRSTSEPGPSRKRYEPPAIKFEKQIEAFAVACSCNVANKSGVTTTTFTGGPGTYCGVDNFS